MAAAATTTKATNGVADFTHSSSLRVAFGSAGRAVNWRMQAAGSPADSVDRVTEMPGGSRTRAREGTRGSHARALVSVAGLTSLDRSMYHGLELARRAKRRSRRATLAAGAMSDAPLRFELERSEEARRKLRAELRTQRDEAQERVDEAEVRLAEARRRRA